MSIVQFPPKKLLGGTKTFPRKGDNPEKGRGGGGWCRNEGVATFLLLYSSIASIRCGGKVNFPLLHFGSSVFWVDHARFSSKS